MKMPFFSDDEVHAGLAGNGTASPAPSQSPAINPLRQLLLGGDHPHQSTRPTTAASSSNSPYPTHNNSHSNSFSYNAAGRSTPSDSPVTTDTLMRDSGPPAAVVTKQEDKDDKFAPAQGKPREVPCWGCVGRMARGTHDGCYDQAASSGYRCWACAVAKRRCVSIPAAAQPAAIALLAAVDGGETDNVKLTRLSEAARLAFHHAGGASARGSNNIPDLHPRFEVNDEEEEAGPDEEDGEEEYADDDEAEEQASTRMEYSTVASARENGVRRDPLPGGAEGQMCLLLEELIGEVRGMRRDFAAEIRDLRRELLEEKLRRDLRKEAVEEALRRDLRDVVEEVRGLRREMADDNRRRDLRPFGRRESDLRG